MPRQTHPRVMHRLLALDKNAPQHARIASVRWLGKGASLRFLRTLIQRKDTPGRLRAICVQMYTDRSIELFLARQERQAATTPNPEGTE